MSADKDRITEIRIKGMRSLEDVTLKLDGLTVLIGENGSGKSTIVEACELLSKIGRNAFQSVFFQRHGGMNALLRHGATSVVLGFDMEIRGEAIAYDLEVAQDGPNVLIAAERLTKSAGGETQVLLHRDRSGSKVTDSQGSWHALRALAQWDVALSHGFATGTNVVVFDVVELLKGIEVHLAFDARPLWARHDRTGMRASELLQSVDRLNLFGANLPTALRAIKEDLGRERWEETLELVRLGIGNDLHDITFPADPGGGSISIQLDFGTVGKVRAHALSDGQVAYLAFVALYGLNKSRSFLAFDEPELHLHPRLLYRVTNMFERLSEAHPVIITTHSNDLLDMLGSPAESTILLELDERRAARARRVDKAALELWREDYRGLGSVRAAGHEGSVFEE